MTTKTVLTDDQIEDIAVRCSWKGSAADTWEFRARAIEQAVLQSEKVRTMDGMACCMDMVRRELIEAGIITEQVAPMFVANAVLAEIQALRRDAERYRFCRSQTSPAEIHIHGVELGLALDSLDEAMDAEMDEWKSWPR